MGRQIGSIHRSISYPANLQSNLLIISFFVFPPTQLPHDNTSFCMDSDTNSNATVYNFISQFNNSDLEAPDNLYNSEPSPSTFSQPPFQPLHLQTKLKPSSTPSSISNVTPQYSPLISDLSNNNSSVHTQISHELDNFITLQQQLQHPQTLTIHQLSQSIISSNPSSPTPSSTPASSTNRAQRNLKRKIPQHSISL